MTITVERARDDVMTRVANGEECECPLCGRLVKLYKRNVYDVMTRFASRLYNLSKGCAGIKHNSRVVMGSGEKASTDASYLDRWGLIVRSGKGDYELTLLGVDWINGKTNVPQWIGMVCGTVVGSSTNLVSFRVARKETRRLATNDEV